MAGQRVASEAKSQADSAIVSLVEDRDLQRIFNYWRGKRRGRLMPSRGDIDPLEIGWALSRIFLVDYDPEKGLVYRLAGANVAGMFGHGNLKGLRPRDFLPPDRAGIIEAAFMRVLEEPAIMVMRGMIYLRVDRLPMGERIFLPLADSETGAANGILGMTVIHAEPMGCPREVIHAEPKFFSVRQVA